MHASIKVVVYAVYADAGRFYVAGNGLQTVQYVYHDMILLSLQTGAKGALLVSKAW
jgi:hypothetical protein